MTRLLSLALRLVQASEGSGVHTIFRSTDRGRSWVRAGMGNARVDAFGAVGKTVFAGAAAEFMYRMTTEGVGGRWAGWRGEWWGWRRSKKRICGDGSGRAFRFRGRTKELAEFGLAREGVTEFAGGSGAVVYGEGLGRVDRRWVKVS